VRSGGDYRREVFTRVGLAWCIEGTGNVPKVLPFSVFFINGQAAVTVGRQTAVRADAEDWAVWAAARALGAAGHYDMCGG